MDTITDTNVGRLANALAVVKNIDPPETTDISVHQDGQVWLHPRTQEDLRTIFSSEAFAGVAWDALSYGRSRWSATCVRGHEVRVDRQVSA